MTKYQEVVNILNRIKQAKKILLVLHADPDPDSVGSNLAMYHLLRGLDKENVAIISSDILSNNLTFLPGTDKIKHEDVAVANLSDFDLFISLDASTPKLLTRKSKGIQFSTDLDIVVIDHHFSNSRFGQVNLIDDKIGSTAELLYNLFIIWKVRVTENIATCLLMGILGDTANFRFGTTADTLEAASKLVRLGARIKDINFNLYRRIPIENFHFWGSILGALKIEKVGKHSFGWSSMPYTKVREFDSRGGRKSAATMFFSSIENTDFGIVLVEEAKGEIKVGMRARTDINVADIAQKFGGGGHKGAAGFRVLLGKENFDDKVQEILDVVKSSLKKNG